MATLTVWKFDDPAAAGSARDVLSGLAQSGHVKIHDAAIVTWTADASKPTTEQAFNPAAAGGAIGAFWGLLFGLVFFVPFFGMAFGAALGVLSGSLSDFGIDDRFIEAVRSKVTPGTSALFLMTSDADVEAIRAAFGGQHIELLATSLSLADETRLAEVFSK